MQIKSWLKAFRLRTLPLAFSPILLGGFLSARNGHLEINICLLALITTLFLQILSNLANDLGDAKAGTDNAKRIGPTRTVQSGEISRKAMKKGIRLFAFLSLLSGLALVYWGTQNMPAYSLLALLILGLLAIGAALNYTLGKNPYGYSGFGDLFVLLFFGFVGVMGMYYLNTQSLHAGLMLPALSVGLMSTAVLNLNNMRDIENDKNSGKRTLAVRLGTKHAKYYHTTIILLALAFAVLDTILQFESLYQLIFLLTFPLFIRDIVQIQKIQQAKALDPYLKKQVLNTLFFSLTFGIGLII